MMMVTGKCRALGQLKEGDMENQAESQRSESNFNLLISLLEQNWN